MEAAKARLHAVNKKQKEAEKTAEVVNITQSNSKRQVTFVLDVFLMFLLTLISFRIQPHLQVPVVFV